MAGYDFGAIERRWQEYWEANGTFRQPNPGEAGFQDRQKLYVLDMFPYPSGAGLHVGHPEGYTASDIFCRHARMKGFNVLHPMGYDAFGLPAEQYAIEHGVHPRETTLANIANIERQIRMFGFSYDWSRRVSTTDPEYYRWTQWIFLRMYNSWYDPADRKARPIGELVRGLQSGQLVVDVDGQIQRSPVAHSLQAIAGKAGGFLEFNELEGDQQRRLIDEHRLAYQAKVPVNWCPALGTVLANEEVTSEGRSERGDHPVYRRALEQWMLRITVYAERLLEDIEPLDWPESIKVMQRNWIGRSTGAEVDFPLATMADRDEWFEQRRQDGWPSWPDDDVLRVFTTRPDTLYGATYMVLAPEHPLVEEITTPQQRDAVQRYVASAAHRSELERTAETKDKTGVFTGAYAVNPITRGEIPIWVADYVMMTYGTGAIMAVPGHDTRDYEFARKFDLPIVQVVAPAEDVDWHGYTDEGTAVHSGPYDGLATGEFKRRITEDLQDSGLGRGKINYRLRDWIFSRQKYWGEPFPLVHCESCGTVPLPEEQLPLELPEMDDFHPETSDDPTAPPRPVLGKATEWVNTTCPACGGPATRELNTMPQWAGSCWYYLRYLDAHNDQRFCSRQAEDYWMGPTDRNPAGGVDLYIGGAEHAVLHLLYARFWHKVLYDLGFVSTSEPFARLFNQGMILGFTYRDGRGVTVPNDLVDTSGEQPVHKQTGEVLQETIEKMSKSLRNVVNPDDIIARYGADTFRLYEMFMGPLEASKPWNTRDVAGVHRFLQRVWRMVAGTDELQPLLRDQAGEQIEPALHKLIRKVDEDIAAMKFNTAIAAMMEFVNDVYRADGITPDQARRFVLVLAPFAPHLAEELWQRLGGQATLAYEAWPAWDERLLVASSVAMPVQVNGKVRGRIEVPADAGEEDVLQAALAEPNVARSLEGKQVIKHMVIPGRLVTLVVK